MAGDILSVEEVDALLRGLQDEDTELDEWAAAMAKQEQNEEVERLQKMNTPPPHDPVMCRRCLELMIQNSRSELAMQEVVIDIARSVIARETANINAAEHLLKYAMKGCEQWTSS
jgi:hypothetical protein